MFFPRPSPSLSYACSLPRGGSRLSVKFQVHYADLPDSVGFDYSSSTPTQPTINSPTIHSFTNTEPSWVLPSLVNINLIELVATSSGARIYYVHGLLAVRSSSGRIHKISASLGFFPLYHHWSDCSSRLSLSNSFLSFLILHSS